MEQGQLREELYQSYRDGLAVPEKAERVERIFYTGICRAPGARAHECDRGRADIREETGSDTGKRELLLKLLIVMGIMSAAALAVIGIRGTGSFLQTAAGICRALPDHDGIFRHRAYRRKDQEKSRGQSSRDRLIALFCCVPRSCGGNNKKCNILPGMDQKTPAFVQLS